MNEIFKDKYLSYMNYLRVIIDTNEKTLGLLLSNGLIIPLENKKYNYKKFKLDIIKCPSLLNFQNKYLLGNIKIDKVSEYYKNYNKINEDLYRDFTQIYNEIKRNKILQIELNKIINHPI